MVYTTLNKQYVIYNKKLFNFLDEKHLIISAIGCIIRLVKIIFGGFKNESELEKILMGGILLSASAVLLTACGGAEKRKLKMKAVQQIKQLVT